MWRCDHRPRLGWVKMAVGLPKGPSYPRHSPSTSTSLPLLFSSYLTLVQSSPAYPLLHLSFYPNLSGRSGRNCLLSPPTQTGYNGSPDTCFSWGMMQLMNWPDREHYLCPLQFLVVSLLLSLISTLVFSWTGGVPFHRNSSTHRLPRFPLRNLCSLITPLCSHSSTLQWTQPSVELLSRIDRIENPSCSTCRHLSQDTSHLILHCPASDFLHHSLFGDSLSLYDLWSRPWGVAWLLGLHGLLPCPDPSEEVG